MESNETRSARSGWFAEFATRPSVPPIYQTTAFDLEGLEQLAELSSGQQNGYIYTRDGNPNLDAFAGDVAALEGAQAGVACASGMGAISATVLSCVRSGEHIVAGRVLYGRSRQLLERLRDTMGLQVSFVDATRVDAVRAALTAQTRLCLVETVSNPLMEVVDVAALAEVLGEIPLFVDSTFTTPSLIEPLALGARYVFHSASKYLNGHGDVMLGVVVGDSERLAPIAETSSIFGMNANPFECWLASRGLRTLELRMQRVSETALRLARFLRSRADVARVFYPGLPDHPQHGLAARQFQGGPQSRPQPLFGGMLSFELPGETASVRRLFSALQTIPFSPTLADARTTISYPTATSHKFFTTEERAACGIGDGLVRLSVGLEAAEDLERELSEALDSLSP